MAEEKKELKSAMPTLNYRYHCPACTGIAFYSEEPNKFGNIVCVNCGTEVGYLEDNYIKLSKEEKRKANAY